MSERFLLIRLSALGDVVNALPAAAWLQASRPGAVVDWVVEDRFASLFEHVDGVRRVIAFPRRAVRKPGPAAWSALARHFAELRRERYDAAVDLQGNLKGALHLRAARADRRIGAARGAAREGAWAFAGVRVRPSGRHRVERALALVAPLCDPAGPGWRIEDGTLPPHLRPRLAPNARARERADALLASLAVPAVDGAFVVAHPGTSAFGAFKRYPPERMGAAVAALPSGLPVLVTYGPGERPLAEAVAAAAGGRARVADTSADLGLLLGVLARAASVIAADSGPLLLASALGRPVVALYGPKDPAVYAPPFAPSAVLGHDVPCRPCSLRRCDDPICMRDLDPAAVARAAHPLIASTVAKT